MNAATVAFGAMLGLAFGALFSPDVSETVMAGLGLVVIGIGLKMMLETQNFVIVAAAIALGGVIGAVLGLQGGIVAFGDWAQTQFGGENPGRFSEAVVVTTILFCAGPMTLLGCIQDGVEGKFEILAIKSTMDGFGAFFFAAAMGPGVLVTAGVILVFQGALTLAARPLQPIARDRDLLREGTAAGGAMLVAIGLGLLEVRSLPVANFLPALLVAPLLVVGQRRLVSLRGKR